MSERRRLTALFLALTFGLAACAVAPPPPAAPAARAGAPLTTQVCAEFLLGKSGARCVRPLSAEEQTHRALAFRLELEDGRAHRLERVNGRGFPEVDDDGCAEYRYRFEGQELVEVTGYQPDGEVCSRTLFTEHVRRASFVDAWGRPNFADDRLHTGTLDERDAQGLVVSMRPLASDGSPSSLQGASEVRYERGPRGLVNRTCYFDPQGKPMKNDSGVHCWSYQRDEFGNALDQYAWDEQQRPATTANGAHHVAWKYDRYGNLERQSLFDVEDRPLTIEGSWCPVLAYHRDAHGFAVGKDCLDGAGKPSRYDEGNSMWRATPDERGRTREVRYFDTNGNPFEPSFGYARYETDHDLEGHVTARRYFRLSGEPGQKDGPASVRYEFNAQHLEVERVNFDGRGARRAQRGCVSVDSEFDAFRQLVRQTCRGATGQPTLSSDDVSITVWHYDARGRLLETSFANVAGKPTNARSGYARTLFSYDAQGVDSHARHFKADGAELHLRRFSVLSVKPPRAGGFWPAPSRALALAKVERARRELLAGKRWAAALKAFADGKISGKSPGDIGYLNFESIYPAARAVLEPLEVGQYSEIAELPYAFTIYLRTE